jgi:hypothetical protein
MPKFMSAMAFLHSLKHAVEPKGVEIGFISAGLNPSPTTLVVSPEIGSLKVNGEPLIIGPMLKNPGSRGVRDSHPSLHK